MTEQKVSSAPRRGFTPAQAFDTPDCPLLRGHLVARSKSELLLVKAPDSRPAQTIAGQLRASYRRKLIHLAPGTDL